MKKNSLIKCLGLVLTAALFLTGCDSGGDNNDVVLGSAGGTGVATTTGGGTGGGTTGGTTGFGLTGGNTGIGGSGTGATTTTTGGTTTATTGGTTTGTTTGGTTGGTTGNVVDNFNRAVTTNTGFEGPLANGVTNPTFITNIGSRLFYIDGIGLGANNGRIITMDIGSPGNITVMTASSGVSTLNNPSGITTDGANLYLTTGFNTTLDGAIVKVSNISVNGNTVTGDFSRLANDPGTGTILNAAFPTVVGGTLFWSEYSGAPNGRVRFVGLNGTTTPATDFMLGLNFPAGLATDGANLVVCDSDGGAGGRVLITSLSSSPLPLTATGTNVTTVSTFAGDQPIRRPFDVKYDGASGFFFTEGAVLPGTSLTASGQTNGAVRFLANGSTESRLVAGSLDNAAGLDAISLDGTNTGIVFAEAIALTGDYNRLVVDTSNPTRLTPSPLFQGTNFPMDVEIIDIGLPLFYGVEGLNQGVGQGMLRIFTGG